MHCEHNNLACASQVPAQMHRQAGQRICGQLSRWHDLLGNGSPRENGYSNLFAGLLLTLRNFCAEGKKERAGRIVGIGSCIHECRDELRR